jgi:hypothetical protein
MKVTTIREISEKEFKTKILTGYVGVILLNSLQFACLECQSNLYHKHEEEYQLSNLPTHIDESIGAPYRGNIFFL